VLRAGKWARLSAAVKKAIDEGAPYAEEVEIQAKEGGRRWAVARGEPVRDAAGTVIELRGMLQDITAAKETERALRDGEERLRLFIRHAPAALAMFDRDMRYLAASQRWMDDYHLGERDIIGQPHYDIFPEIGEPIKAAHRRALAGEVVRKDEDCFERLDGSRQWLRWETRPWHDRDGAVGGILVFTEDITARKQSEKALDEAQRVNLEEQRQARLAALNLMEDAVMARRQAEAATAALRVSEGRLRLAQDAAKAGTWEWDIPTNHNFWSDEAYRLYGLEPGSITPSYDAWLNTIHPEDREAAALAVNGAAGRGEPLNVEWRVNLAPGIKRWLLALGQPQFDEAGRLLRYVGIVMDITERKHAEAALLESEKRFHDIVNASADWVWEVDAAGRYIYVSDSVTALLGYAPEELLGKTPSTSCRPPKRSGSARRSPPSSPARKLFATWTISAWARTVRPTTSRPTACPSWGRTGNCWAIAAWIRTCRGG
jgi:two-component system sensor histidine kinase/response regulator